MLFYQLIRLREEIDQMRRELTQLVQTRGLTDEQVLNVSEELEIKISTFKFLIKTNPLYHKMFPREYEF